MKLVLIGFLAVCLILCISVIVLRTAPRSKPIISSIDENIVIDGEPTTSITTSILQHTQTSLPVITPRVQYSPTTISEPIATSITSSHLRTPTPTVYTASALPTITQTLTPISRSNWHQGQISYMASHSGGSALFISNLQNPTPPTLIAQSESSLSFLGAVLSLDGEKIAYYQYRDDLFIVNAQANATPYRLGACRSPSWSSQGDQIMCSGEGNIFAIFEISSGDIIQTLSGDIRGVIPSWSPVRPEMVYASFEGDNTDIWIAPISVGSPILLAGDSSENYAPSWSPDGNYIAYQSNQGSMASEIWVMDRFGNDKRRLTYTPNGGWSRAPSWSPDGLWLAFVSNQSGSIGADYGEIFIISVDSGELIQLTETGGIIYDWRVSWGR